jgi:outer membrane protein TolC
MLCHLSALWLMSIKFFMRRPCSVQRDVIENVTNAWTALDTDKKRSEELHKRVNSAQALLDGYKKQFEYGKRTLLDVLNEEKELFDAQIDQCNVEFAVINDTYALLAAIGTLTDQFLGKKHGS